MPSPEVNQLARILLGYHKLNHELGPADCIIGLGTNDPRVAERAADLFLQGLAPCLLFTGGVSSWTQGIYHKSEAEAFADIAVEKGVPRESIMIEPKASNTGENIKFSKDLLSSQDSIPDKLILVQKPYMERRTFATCKQFWPELDIMVASPDLVYEDFPQPWLSLEEVIHIMVGDLHRISVYPGMGFQIEQDIPEEVWEAFHRLNELGFNKHLVPA